jgi:hypothetical protein
MAVWMFLTAVFASAMAFSACDFHIHFYNTQLFSILDRIYAWEHHSLFQMLGFMLVILLGIIQAH